MKQQSPLSFLPSEVRKAIASLPQEKKKRCTIMAECGVRLKLGDVEHIRTLENETQLTNFCRKLLFPH